MMIVDQYNHKTFLDLIKSLPDKPWDWWRLNSIFCANLIKLLPDKPWNWESICERLDEYDDNEYFDLVRSFPDKPWDWKYISEYGIHEYFDFIRSYPNKPWIWKFISNHESYIHVISSPMCSISGLHVNVIPLN